MLVLLPVTEVLVVIVCYLTFNLQLDVRLIQVHLPRFHQRIDFLDYLNRCESLHIHQEGTLLDLKLDEAGCDKMPCLVRRV